LSLPVVTIGDMKLRTKFSRFYNVHTIEEVLATLSLLGWREEDDDCLVCDNGSNGYLQLAKYRPGHYIVEWCGGSDPTHSQHGLWRAQSQIDRGELVEVGREEKGQFHLYRSELLPLTDALDVLTAFWRGGDWPCRLYWRSMATEMKRFIQLSDRVHGRMNLCE